MVENKRNTLLLDPKDNVIIALRDLTEGSLISQNSIITKTPVPSGHKVSVCKIPAGEPILKYGHTIGIASRPIEEGEHVHSQNLKMVHYKSKSPATGSSAAPPALPEDKRRYFQGIVRSNGDIATRNYIGILPMVGCSSTVARYIAEAFGGDALKAFPNVDGIVPLVHSGGCAMASEGESMEAFLRCLGGFITHPNFAGALLVGLGCETNQIDRFLNKWGLSDGPMFRTLGIQEIGGTKAAVEKGISIVKGMLPLADEVERTPVPASRLVAGLECGGSDAYSGITANPALGYAMDMLVNQGGTAILSETTEIYGAEQILLARTGDENTAARLIKKIEWWEDYTSRNGYEIDNNPTPGNKAGGLTTIAEKSLGAVAKGGTTTLNAVYDYAEQVRESGFVFMDTPAYDLPSITAMVAGGANIICFTTGRGSTVGCKPSPVIKLASNTEMYEKMSDDMDVNCGVIADGVSSLKEMGRKIFEEILATASGKKTRSEIYGYGDDEFVPWQMGVML